MKYNEDEDRWELSPAESDRALCILTLACSQDRFVRADMERVLVAGGHATIHNAEDVAGWALLCCRRVLGDDVIVCINDVYSLSDHPLVAITWLIKLVHEIRRRTANTEMYLRSARVKHPEIVGREVDQLVMALQLSQTLAEDTARRLTDLLPPPNMNGDDANDE